MTKAKSLASPRIDVSILEETFAQQLATGAVCDAVVSNAALPPLQSLCGQPIRIDRCVWRSVSLPEPKAHGLRLRDVHIEDSDMANIDLTGASLERVEFTATRLTGTICTEAHLKSVLFLDCKLDLAMFRMARLERCVFENCNFRDADFYAANLPGGAFRGCDLSRADLSHANLRDADLRGCRLDGMRGTPANMNGLIITPDQAALLITLFGVHVEW